VHKFRDKARVCVVSLTVVISNDLENLNKQTNKLVTPSIFKLLTTWFTYDKELLNFSFNYKTLVSVRIILQLCNQSQLACIRETDGKTLTDFDLVGHAKRKRKKHVRFWQENTVI